MIEASTSLRILIVDDSPEDRELYRRYLVKAGQCDYDFIEAETGEEGLARCRKEKPDCVLLDYNIPDLDGLNFLDELANDDGGISTPIVMLTGEDNEFVAAEAMERGAQDYIIKGDVNPSSISRAVRYAIHRQTTQSQNKRLIGNLSSRNQEILQLAYAMTHDLQTPLASLTGTVDALERHLEDRSDDQTSKWLVRINQSVNRMTRMLDDLMTYVRAGNEKVDMQSVEMEELIDQILLEMVEVASKKDITFDVARPFPRITGDPKQVYRIFSNLIGNGVKYASADGDVHITISATTRNDSVQFRIVDNGPGIDPKFLDKVFLPFKRATHKEEGSGIGLATVRRIVEQHNGRVWLESDGRSGTTAVVDLPSVKSEAAIPEGAPA